MLRSRGLRKRFRRVKLSGAYTSVWSASRRVRLERDPPVRRCYRQQRDAALNFQAGTATGAITPLRNTPPAANARRRAAVCPVRLLRDDVAARHMASRPEGAGLPTQQGPGARRGALPRRPPARWPSGADIRLRIRRNSVRWRRQPRPANKPPGDPPRYGTPADIACPNESRARLRPGRQSESRQSERGCSQQERGSHASSRTLGDLPPANLPFLQASAYSSQRRIRSATVYSCGGTSTPCTNWRHASASSP